MIKTWCGASVLLRMGMIVGCMALCARDARAQELAANFDQLRVLVGAGQTVSVTDTAGREVKGSIVSLSPSSIALLVKGARVEFRDADVVTVRQRRPDSLANGAKIGFAVGGVLGFLGGLALYEEDGGAGLFATVVLIYGGIGAGVGTGVDAMIESERPIYSRSAGSPGRVSLRPIVGQSRRGVSLAIRF